MKKLFAHIFCPLIPFSGPRQRLRMRLLHPVEYAWRKANPHNTTTLGRVTNSRVITVGRGTYGQLNIESPSDDDIKIVIGNFCSIGPDVHFILASEHPYRGFSTYPFKVKLGLQKYEAKSKGDIIVDDDVWFGRGVIVNSGVHIGRGAIIASGTIVVHDIEPYSIVGGNPAKHIKYRFPEKIRKKLMQIDFANLDTDKIKQHIDIAYQELTENNIDSIIQTVTKQKDKR